MANKKYLDENGLDTFWQLIKEKIPSKYASSQSAGGAADKAAAIPFGAVDSTSTATDFTATIDGITELVDGTCMLLYNGVVTSASGFTININGLGAKPVFSNLTAATRDTTIFNVAYTMLFIYDSTRVVGEITGAWCCYRGYDANTNTIGYQLRTNSMTLPASAKFYRYRLLFTSANGTHFVPANTSTSTNATAKRDTIQTPIDPFGRIVYYGTTTAINAEATPSATILWDQYVLNLGYSFNRTGAALVLQENVPVYLKCAPQSDGSAIIDADTPYVQALPNAEDGKIYIFLGWAYGGAANIELSPVHPVYCYRKGKIQQWTGVQTEIDSLKTSDLTNDSGFITSAALPDVSDVVRYSVQNLNDNQQAQVRANISSDEIFVLKLTYNDVDGYRWKTQYGVWANAAGKYKYYILEVIFEDHTEYYYNYKTLTYLNIPLALFTQTNVISNDAVSLSGATINALYFLDTDREYENIITASYDLPKLSYVNDIADEITALQSTVSSIETTVSSIYGDISNFSSDISSLQSSMSDAQTSISSLQESFTSAVSYLEDAIANNIPLPTAPNDGDFLVWSSSDSAWVAQALSSWQGGSY